MGMLNDARGGKAVVMVILTRVLEGEIESGFANI